ncbi:MAG: hypothetical protein SGI88_10145 [Candidatus Hydrogenedentes bacterium]|nr:hypothetical protein [Candidatus Hydrogenedentota bacterium]
MGGSFPPQSYNEIGEMQAIMASEVIARVDDTESSAFSRSTVYLISPSNDAKVVASNVHCVDLYPRLGWPQHPHIAHAVLACGRGFSRCIDQINSVTKLENGLLRCEADGSYFDMFRKTEAVWHLEVDPNNAYLVRKADCFIAETQTHILDISDEGTKTFARGPMPELGKFHFVPGESHGDPAVSVVLEDMMDAPDTDLLALAEQHCRAPFPLGTNVSDHLHPPRLVSISTEGKSSRPESKVQQPPAF